MSARTKEIVCISSKHIHYDIPRRYIRFYLDDRYNLDTTEGMLDMFMEDTVKGALYQVVLCVCVRAPIIVVIMYPVFTDHGRLHCHYLLCPVV